MLNTEQVSVGGFEDVGGGDGDGVGRRVGRRKKRQAREECRQVGE